MRNIRHTSARHEDELKKAKAEISDGLNVKVEYFVADMNALGIDLNDAATIPPRISGDGWPGVAKVFERIVGKLPTPRDETRNV